MQSESPSEAEYNANAFKEADGDKMLLPIKNRSKIVVGNTWDRVSNSV